MKKIVALVAEVFIWNKFGADDGLALTHEGAYAGPGFVEFEVEESAVEVGVMTRKVSLP